MIELINPEADIYSRKFTSPLDDVLQENERITVATNRHAEMLSGHVQGKFLEFISQMIRPERILEIGTFTGFSALSLVKGLKEGGMLHTIEIRNEDAINATSYIQRSKEENSIVIHVGNAIEVIPRINENWDLVFIDADKVSYIEYYELTLPFVRPGGWIIADNVLFHGEVFSNELRGKNAKAIHAFNTHVAADNRVEQVMLTVRDGLLIIRKL